MEQRITPTQVPIPDLEGMTVAKRARRKAIARVLGRVLVWPWMNPTGVFITAVVSGASLLSAALFAICDLYYRGTLYVSLVGVPLVVRGLVLLVKNARIAFIREVEKELSPRQLP